MSGTLFIHTEYSKSKRISDRSTAMSFVSSALFAISASLDAFIVGVNFGIRKIHIPFLHNLIISLITLAGTVLSILFGQSLAPLLPAETASLAGSVLLILIGIFYLLKSMYEVIKKYQSDPLDKKPVSDNEIAFTRLGHTFLLGITLSINNMGIGISASIAGLPLLSAALLTLFFSIALLTIGNRIGNARPFRYLQQYADPLSGLLLIGLGLL